MIVPGSPNALLLAQSGDPLDELGKIDRSLRLRASAASYLSWVPSVAGNRSVWTWFGWLKPALIKEMALFLAGGTSQNFSMLSIHSTGAVRSATKISDVYSTDFHTTSLVRDSSAHCQLVIARDGGTTHRIWVNDVLVGDIASPSEADSFFNSVTTHYIGRRPFLSDAPIDGQLSHCGWVDGQALTPSAFGQFHPRTGQWRPKTKAAIRAAVAAGGGPRNGWGTNGFFLTFDDVTSLTTLCYDRSQSDTDTTGNNWAATNISLTAGATYDSMLDTPTNNFCTWNPLVYGDSTKSAGNLIAAGIARGTMNAGAFSSQWEITANASGVVGGAVSGSGTVSTVSIPSGSTYGFRLSSGLLEYTADGVSWTTIGSGLSGVMFPYAGGASNTLNCGQRAMTYAMSSGYKALCTKNLPLSGGTVTVSGSFTGTATADGPLIYCNGAPETLTINGNAVTFGTHADRLANGFKLRTALTSYNSTGTNTWTATILSPEIKSTFRYQNAKGNP